MSSAVDTMPYELARATRVRWRYGATRLVMCVVASAATAQILGWRLTAVWLAVWIATQAVEFALVYPAIKERPLSAARTRVALASLSVSVIVYGAVVIPLWRTGGAIGGFVALLLISGGFFHNLVVCQDSRRVFFALVMPNLFYLALSPVLALMSGVDALLAGAMTGGMVIFGINGMVLWRSIESKHRAEQDAQRALQASLKSLEEAAAAKSAFMAMVAHELRTPISGVLAASGELERAPDDGVRDHARMIGDAGRLMRTVLNDLLDFAKLETGKMSVENTAFDLRELVHQTCRFWSLQALEKDLDLKAEGADYLPRGVLGDPTRLRQILNNLLSNAVKFTETGEVAVSVAVEDAGGRKRVRIAVKDSGPGITPEKIAELFAPFAQADASVARTHGGTGLGLAISRELARLMNGELTVDSRPGEGSTFTLTLPLTLAQAPRGATGPAPAYADVAPLKARLLIVDDHPINRRAMQLLLGPIKPEIVEAENGERALELLAVEAFDLVLTDVTMPGISGPEAVRRLRAAEGPNQDVPVIAVTASADDKDIRACYDAGMDGYVAKPLDARELLEAVSRAIAGARDEGEEDEARTA